MARKKTSVSTKSRQPQRARLYIVGDSPLVEEYAELCSAKGYDVAVQWNEAPASWPPVSSKAIKRTNVIGPTTSLGIELTGTKNTQKQKNLIKLDKSLPPTAPILSTSITLTATEQSNWITYKHRLVGISALPSFSQHALVEIAPTVYTPKETIDAVQRFCHSLGKEIEVVQDRVGMVLPRIVCQIINEATFAVQEDVATPQDIDTAMKLGTNYPFGPIEWAQKIGFQQVYAVLNALENDLHEERYRASPLLKVLAQTGEWWKKH
ncbi:MAG: 3-hydroxyacyl-CoA dehydrogenase family protein [Bacteroidota bacterium]